MPYKTRIAVCLLAWLGTILPAVAATTNKGYVASAAELIATVERLDPQTKTQPEAWQRIRQALQTAGSEAESSFGFRLSVNHILSHWEGRGFRVLDDTDAQYFAWHSQATTLREAGAWFHQKGSKWYARHIARRPTQPLQRGDSIARTDFHPTQSWTQAPLQALKIQGHPLEPSKELSLKVRTVTLADWALEETQAASSVLTLGGKRLCQERLWLWQTQAVGAVLQSKLRFAQENCDALLIDLRSSFGVELPHTRLKGPKTIPVVVLVNEQTREGPVSLALHLKEELGAKILGEPTASRQLPQEKVEMSSFPFLVLVYATASGSLLPDLTLKDSWVATGGLDPLYERGVLFLKETLDR